MKLVQVGDHWINPNRIISIAPFGGANEMNQFYVNVDMGGWTASYPFVSTTECNPDTVAALLIGAMS